MKAWMCRSEYLLTLALAGGEWSASRPGRLTARERGPGTLCIEGWVDPRTGLDDMEKRKFLILLGLELLTATGKCKFRGDSQRASLEDYDRLGSDTI
jgi:hypothetical protein